MKKQQQQSSMHSSAHQKGHRPEQELYGASAATTKAAYVEASQHYASTPAAVTEPTWKLYCDCRLKSFQSGR